MNKRKVTLAAAAAGVVTGVVGLGVLAMPAGAGQAPDLPPVTAQSLVESVLTAKPTAFGGTVDVVNNMGLPPVGSIPQLADGTHSARMWTDGDGRLRLSLPDGQSEQTIVDDGTTTWTWNSKQNEVRKADHGQAPKPEQHSAADPVATAKQAVAAVEEFSTVTVDGTARVANRAAYELVLTPKPTEKTLLREIRVAVDSEMRIPLRVAVYTHGTNAPVGQVGFAEMNVGPQDPALFKFTPPAGAKVNDAKTEDLPMDTTEEAFLAAEPQAIGDGWDVVFGARLPQGSSDLSQMPAEGRGLVERFTKEVSGSWGHGRLFSTKVGNLLVADDGRAVAGAVPEQVLFDAIGQVK